MGFHKRGWTIILELVKLLAALIYFMKFCVVLFFNLVVLAYFGFGQKKPNILWFITEDIGCDMACYETKGVHTPYMDQLAKEGALYTRAYTTASICSPSRSSFMTGLYPHQVFSKNMRIRPPLEKKSLPEGVDIFTKYLRDAGYFIGFPGHGKKDWTISAVFSTNGSKIPGTMANLKTLP